MTDQIVLKEPIIFVAMNSTTTDLRNIGMGIIVKDGGMIVETDKSNM